MRRATAPLLAEDPDRLIAALVHPDMSVHCAATPSRANALLYALARVFAGQRRLTISVAAVHSSAHALALSGAVRRVITGFLGDICPAPRPSRLYDRALNGDPFEVELWSLLSLVQRLLAGAQGLPYAVTGSLAGSSLLDTLGPHAVSLPDPRDGTRSLTLISAWQPDVTLLHGVCADRRGNVVLVPPLGDAPWSAYAARQGVIASVERIVPDSVIDTIADRVVVPAQRVIGLCEAPRGAHPQALRTGGVAKVPGYGDDYLFMADTARQCGEPLEAERWYSRWVDLPDGHAGYLRTLAERRPAELPRGTPPKALTAAERVVLLTARSLVSLVLGEGYDCFFAGVGLSHLAAWCAAEELTERGIAVRVCAETGLSGMRPADGDPFLFGHAHVERCEALSSVLEMLGILGSADRGRWLGVLSAAEVDSRGCLNTVRTPDGRWLTGSGGANDIGTSIDCVVAAVAAPHRYVPRVAHVTTPGHRVREVVSQFGRFRRTGPEASPFRLATWLPPNPQGTPGEAMAALTRWAWADEGDAPCPEHAFSDEEITRLRRFDPAGHFR